MSKILGRIKAGEIRLNNVNITMFCLFPIDYMFLLKVFNDLGYEAIAPSFTPQMETLMDKRVNIVETDDFKLDYYMDKKLLEFITNDELLIESFNKVMNIIKESNYDIIDNIVYYELVWRINNVKSEKWKEKLKSIETPVFNDLSSLFGVEKMSPHGIYLTPQRNAITMNWFGIRITPSRPLGDNYFTLEIVKRNESLDDFLDFIKKMPEKIEKLCDE
ncbi:MAG: hypothetical protein KAU62_02025 [Candidatus Heimdallarchaeota archaeon]|nr:hypothetical protein [Candidatus Heimdallarchaeota archaeon]MCK4609911.1 hypothetical protein [Candidatus Heimdallarchaeota archaeon]